MTLRLDQIRDYDKGPIDGIDLRWSIAEYSQPVRLPGREHDTHLKRGVDEHGQPEERTETENDLPPGLVPYTEERLHLLEDLQLALTELDKKMVKMFGGAPEQIGELMDAVLGAVVVISDLLLPALPPAAERKPRKKR